MSNIIAPQTIAPQNFEEALKELESLVKKFEGGQFTLDQAIAAYERGFFLKEQCLAKLQQAKAKIESVMAEKSGLESGDAPRLSPEPISS
jgi:exodeoxyribonuclease VII small subunit